MAEAKKKDNFLLIVGVAAVLSIVLVLLLKGRETEHLQYGAESTVQQEAEKFEGIKNFNNVIGEE